MPGKPLAGHPAREESLRCILLRHRARQASMSSEDGAVRDTSFEVALAAPDTHRLDQTSERRPSYAEKLKEEVCPPAEPATAGLVQPPGTVPSPEADQERPWQYEASQWRRHPLVARLLDEAFIFIPAASYPAHAGGAAALVDWLRQTGTLSWRWRGLGSLHSGVIMVAGVGWIVTLGNIPGAMSRMSHLLECKAGQKLVVKGKEYIIRMETHMPLDQWMC